MWLHAVTLPYLLHLWGESADWKGKPHLALIPSPELTAQPLRLLAPRPVTPGRRSTVLFVNASSPSLARVSSQRDSVRDPGCGRSPRPRTPWALSEGTQYRAGPLQARYLGREVAENEPAACPS